jgi:ketosteroid isomerase-like protein
MRGRGRGARFLPILTELDPEDRDAAVAANRDFYRAFNQRDIATIDQLWARNAPLVCMHPNQVPLTERTAIVRSWQRILSTPNLPLVHCQDEILIGRRHMVTIVCREVAATIQLIATNVFVKEDGAWRLVHHQSGNVPFKKPTAPAQPVKRDRRKMH